jgi:hypothetical protein
MKIRIQGDLDHDISGENLEFSVEDSHYQDQNLLI